MKRLLLFISALFVCTVAIAHTINWHVDGNIYQTTTCDSGESITPPTAPYKYGYHFVEWKLPYTEIEYLESTGTQWIDTEFRPKDTSGMMIDYYANKTQYPLIAFVSENNATRDSFGVSEYSTNARILIYNCRNTNQHMEWWGIGSLYGNGTGRYKVYINGRNASVTASNDQVITYSFPNYSYSNTLSLVLFGGNVDGKVHSSPVRIYSCKLYDNNTLVRDFIPVLDFNGVPCMYDRVEHKYYYNAGTGQFIAGPVISE